MSLGMSNPADAAFEAGKVKAIKFGHPTLATEHVVLAMLENRYVVTILEHCNVDPVSLYEEVHSRTQTENVVVTITDRTKNILLDPSLSEVLARAGNIARVANRTAVNLADLLVAISQSTTRSWLADIMRAHHLDTHAIIEALSRMAINQEHETSSLYETPAMAEETTGATADHLVIRANRRRDEELLKYAVCLTAQARAGKLDPVIGRTQELDRVIQTLARRTKNNPLLVGEPGVGKTAIANALALRIVEGTVPAKLRHVRLYALNMGNLVAGTKYRGDFELRIKGILDEVRLDPNIVLMIDEIHMMLGAGAASGGNMDAANLFKPALASGALRVIGATTYDEYREAFSKDRALSRRFQKIDVTEPSQEATREILKGVKGGLEAHHGVTYSPEAIELALSLSVRHLPDRLLPDKAIDVLDEAGAYAHLSGNSQVVTPAIIEAVIAQMAQVPVGQVSTSDRDRLRGLETQLRNVIFGQDEAITTLVKAVKVARAGLREGEHPVASLLFAGPTGVGKTELTAQLAKQLNMPLIRFDMSEYLEAHSVSRLIGAPPGYVGHEAGGLLTEAVSRKPHAVVLLDEIEKAHPSITQILLQIMDRGKLTDTHGREVDFRNTVVVLTTNAGAAISSRRTMGFVDQDNQSDALESIRTTFTPEFRNRLDAVVNFHALGRVEIQRVVDKVLGEMMQQLTEKHIALHVSPAACNWLADHGHNPEFGARPMRRLMETTLGEPLADAILFGDLDKGGEAFFDLVQDHIVGQFTQAFAVPETTIEEEMSVA